MECLKAATFTAADKPGPRVGSWILQQKRVDEDLIHHIHHHQDDGDDGWASLPRSKLRKRCRSLGFQYPMACHLLVDRESRLVVGVSNQKNPPTK